MKYIKKFEISVWEPLDKFIIILSSNPNGYLLLEIKEADDGFVNFEAIFKLYKGKITTIRDNNTLMKSVITKRLKYQSNSLEDALEHLELLSNVENYNI